MQQWRRILDKLPHVTRQQLRINLRRHLFFQRRQLSRHIAAVAVKPTFPLRDRRDLLFGQLPAQVERN